MRNIVTNELEDKKIIKDIIRYAQSLYKRWGKEQPCSIDGSRLKVFDFDGAETFFGYYDRSPFNELRQYLLFHRSKLSTRLNPRTNKPIELVLWDYNRNREIKSWELWAYNWQQGAKPQWIDGERFIFNNFDPIAQKYYSVLVDIKNQSEKKYSCPSYEACKDFYLTLNFSRLAKLRPDYGYRNVSNVHLDDVTDGVFSVSFADNIVKMLVSLEQLKQTNPKPSMEKAKHKVNHIVLSPDRKKFMFMHRWINRKGKQDRLYVYDLEAHSFHCVADYGMVSHCYWYGEDIIGYMNGADNKPGYYRIFGERIERLHDKIQGFGDGHPTILEDEMVFDTYPDSRRLKHLYHYNLKSDSLYEIGRFKESLGYENQCRCDLHPRLITPHLVSVDSTHTGKRCLCLIEI